MVGILCCLMATGIRPGELPALLWDEVDLESTPATLIVSGCVVRQDGVLLRQPEPKTAAGYRQIVIPDWFAQMLRERRANDHLTVPTSFLQMPGHCYACTTSGRDLGKYVGKNSATLCSRVFAPPLLLESLRFVGQRKLLGILGIRVPASPVATTSSDLRKRAITTTSWPSSPLQAFLIHREWNPLRRLHR